MVIDPDPQNAFVGELEKLRDERIWIVKGWKLGTFNQFVQNLLPDLREEEIDAKMISTFKALSLDIRNSPVDMEEDRDG